LYAGLLTFIGSNFANDGKTVKHAFVFASSWLVGWAYPLVSSNPPTHKFFSESFPHQIKLFKVLYSLGFPHVILSVERGCGFE
jgi:hypothetical protein